MSHASPKMQFGGGPDTEPKGLSRDNEPDEFFATNMDDMSDAEKIRSPVVIGGLALLIGPFIVGASECPESNMHITPTD